MASDGQRRSVIRAGELLPLVPVALFALLVVLLPVAALFGRALAATGGLGALAVVLRDPLTQAALGNSLEQGALSAAVAGAAGYPVGLLVGRFRFPGREGLRAFLLLPFLLPSLVVVLGVEQLFGPAGYVSALLPATGVLGHGLPGIVAVNVVFNASMVALFTAAAVEGSSQEQEEAAAVLGASPARIYRELWGPASWVGAGAGVLLTFLLAALGFAAPLVICGARCYTLEARIWSLDQVLGEPAVAGVVALATLLLLSVPALGYIALLRTGPRRSVRRLRSAPPFPWRDPRWWPLAAYTAVFVAGLAALLGAVLVRSVAPPGAALGSGWTQLFSASVTARLGLSTPAAIANSLLFATAATLLVLLLGIVTAFARRGGGARGTAIDYVLFLPLLVSPVLLAFGLASFWQPVLGGASSSWALILLSQATIALPFATQSLRLGLARLDRAPWEAARVLGSGPFSAFLDAELPRVRPALVAATLFAFAFGIGEFTATYFLVRPQFTTLPVELLRLEGLRLGGAADALAGLLVVVSAITFLVLEWGGERVEL
jgi:thiamine transport system permease protein